MTWNRVIALYLALLVLLAALGGMNQVRFAAQVALMDEKQDTMARVVELRAQAAEVQGPRAVTEWAEAHGMVPAPENDLIENVAPLAAPVVPDRAEGLEVRTVWQ